MIAKAFAGSSGLGRTASGGTVSSGEARLPLNVEVCDIKTGDETVGVYGIGMKINREAPHVVQLVSNLKDSTGKSCNSSILEGDTLMRIDGNLVENSGINTLENLVLGEKDTTAVLTLRSKASGQMYSVTVLRHVPIRQWEETHQWLELKPALQNSQLGVDASVLEPLERIRHAVVNRAQRLIDFQRMDVSEECTLGIVFALEVQGAGMLGNQVFELEAGGPAALQGELRRGDEVVAVDGVAVGPAPPAPPASPSLRGVRGSQRQPPEGRAARGLTRGAGGAGRSTPRRSPGRSAGAPTPSARRACSPSAAARSRSRRVRAPRRARPPRAEPRRFVRRFSSSARPSRRARRQETSCRRALPPHPEPRGVCAAAARAHAAGRARST